MKLIKSPAKINIGLKIIAKRPDGYHNLESVFQEISLYDDIYIEKRKTGIRFSCNDPAIPSDDRNLCIRAFRLLQKSYGVKEGVDIRLVKKIPVGAGLGGGSSNSAACLKAFSKIFNLNLEFKDLMNHASRLGSDVPFFITGKTALVTGRGEVVTPIHFPVDYQILLAYPDLTVSTAEVFKNFEFGLTEIPVGIKFEAVIFRVKTLEDLNRYFYNDLEPIVQRLYPEVSELRRRLQDTGAKFVSMSGSGSAVYALFEPEKDLEKIAKEQFKNDRVFLARPVYNGV
jgi:4-diphosphocytidyl-2-C-methyl-D-erythritol kinase